jgi:hypothetical protein
MYKAVVGICFWCILTTKSSYWVEKNPEDNLGTLRSVGGSLTLGSQWGPRSGVSILRMNMADFSQWSSCLPYLLTQFLLQLKFFSKNSADGRTFHAHFDCRKVFFGSSITPVICSFAFFLFPGRMNCSWVELWVTIRLHNGCGSADHGLFGSDPDCQEDPVGHSQSRWDCTFDW